MKPFELAITLKSPMIVGNNSVRLDGLIWHCLYLHYHDPVRAQHELGRYLKLSDSGRYYHASSMQFGVLGALHTTNGLIYDNIVATHRSTVGAMRQGKDLSPELFKPNGRGGNYAKLNLGGIPYKSRLTKHPAYYSRYVVFHGFGNGEEIADLIGFYVPAIGVNASKGFGTIGKLYVKDLDQDLSVIGINGQPARSIPKDDEIVQSIDSARVENAILIPPFRNQQSVLCVVPERIRKFKINNPE